MTLDIGARHGYPSAALSNFAAHRFTLDGVECSSMEGFLQSLKFDKPHIQVEVCKLVGIAAKHRGKDRNTAWKTKMTLWWKGEAIPRLDQDYQRLLDRAYLELTRQSENFRKALLDTGDLKLTHTIGRNREYETILTQREFCDRLEKLRAHLVKGRDLNRLNRI